MKDYNFWAIVKVGMVDLDGLCERSPSAPIGFSAVHKTAGNAIPSNAPVPHVNRGAIQSYYSPMA